MIVDPTKRFSSRVENYLKYRPGYPEEILQALRKSCGLVPTDLVADIGSGTGIFSEILLKNGNRVFAVEPNDEMRGAAQRLLSGYPAVEHLSGTAEATTLPDHCVDLVTAAQAFHWFDRVRTRSEFARVLKPGGWISLIWNDRQLDSTPFLREYEALLQRFGTDYLAVRHKDLDLNQVCEFVGSHAVTQSVLESRQTLDYKGIEGRLMSSSYAPEAGHTNHVPMLAELHAIFQRHQRDGYVPIVYDTRIFCAQLPVQASPESGEASA